ncbi:hypothetical protein Hanom_Chr02g00125791 [Helianthus anomalus]
MIVGIDTSNIHLIRADRVVSQSIETGDIHNIERMNLLCMAVFNPKGWKNSSECVGRGL